MHFPITEQGGNMQIIENNIVKEKVYIEKLDNGLTVMIMPKKEVQKKFFIWRNKIWFNR